MARMGKSAENFATSKLRQIGTQLGAVFSTYALANFAKEVGTASRELLSLSQTYGISVEHLQALQVLFQRNGHSAAELDGVLMRLQRNLNEATVEPHMAKSVKLLFGDFESVSKMSLDQVFARIAQAMADSSSDATTLEAAGKLLGRTYASLKDIALDLSRNGLENLTESLKRTNQVMGQDSVEAANRMLLAYEEVGRKLRTAAGNKLVEAVGGIYGIGATVDKTNMLKAGLLAGGGTAGLLALLGALGAPITGGASLLLTLGGGLAGALAYGASTADYGKMAKMFFPEMFQEPKSPMQYKRENDAIDAARKATAEAMRKAAEEKRKRERETSAIDRWYEDAVSKIKVGAPQAANSLLQIGGYMGARLSPAYAIAERALRLLEIDKERQERIAQAAEKTAENTAAISVFLED